VKLVKLSLQDQFVLEYRKVDPFLNKGAATLIKKFQKLTGTSNACGVWKRNLAIANRSRVTCAHTTSRASIITQIDRIRVPFSIPLFDVRLSHHNKDYGWSNYGAILYRLRDIANSWSKIAKFLYPTCILRSHRGDAVGISRRCLILVRPRWLGYPWWINCDDMLRRLGTIPERDWRTDRIAISISLVSVLWRDKQELGYETYKRPVHRCHFEWPRVT